MNLKKLKEKQGITLIALIITIIVLLILAGVSIAMLAGNNGILTRTKSAKQTSEIAGIKEEIKTEIIAEQAENEGNISESALKTILEKYGTINYDEDGEKIKSITTKKEDYEIAMSDIWKGKTTSTEGIKKVETTGDISDTEIKLTWTELVQVAEMISQNNNIDKDTTSVTVKVGNKETTLTVGNYTTVKYDGVEKKVRIIGFNTDTKASGGKAGITFDFVTTLGDATMNSTSTNVGGWGSSELKGKMTEYLNKLTSSDGSIQLKDIVKPVTKTYNIGGASSNNPVTTTNTSTDSLWLLADLEIFPKTDINGNELSSIKEGEQYRYYVIATNGVAYSSDNPKLVKYSDLTSTNSCWWWLRTPSGISNDSFVSVHSNGVSNYDDANFPYGVAPGFCI